MWETSIYINTFSTHFTSQSYFISSWIFHFVILPTYTRPTGKSWQHVVNILCMDPKTQMPHSSGKGCLSNYILHPVPLILLYCQRAFEFTCKTCTMKYIIMVHTIAVEGTNLAQMWLKPSWELCSNSGLQIGIRYIYLSKEDCFTLKSVLQAEPC